MTSCKHGHMTYTPRDALSAASLQNGVNAGQELVPRYDQCQESKDHHWKQAVSQKAAAAVQAKRLRLWILSASHVIHYQPHHNAADYAPAQNDAKMQLACLQGTCMHGLLLEYSNRVVAK